VTLIRVEAAGFQGRGRQKTMPPSGSVSRGLQHWATLRFDRYFLLVACQFVYVVLDCFVVGWQI